MNLAKLLLGLLASLSLAAVAYLVVTRTEWVEIEVDEPLRGEAATDEWYAAQGLLRRLGVQVVRQSHLDELPAPPATVWLESTAWDLFPERSERLHQWVQQGGHLVVRSHQLEDDELLAEWAPIDVHTPAPEPLPPQAASRPARPRLIAPFEPCLALREVPVRTASTLGTRPLQVCGFFNARQMLTSPTPSVWSLQGPGGEAYFMRVALGKGLLTAMGPLPVRNRELPAQDHAIALAATLALRPGQTLWLITHETRPPLLATLWHRGAPALLLGGLAVAFALWRSGIRFGPLVARPPAARRSVAEQVRGTARFVWNHNPAALLTAQQRATDTAARRHVPRYDQMPVHERATALAGLSGLPQDALAQALAPHPPARMRLQALSLLERIRRRLAFGDPPDTLRRR